MLYNSGFTGIIPIWICELSGLKILFQPAMILKELYLLALEY
jgi:hypothetical protein